MARWWNDPARTGVVWVDGCVDPLPLARQRIVVAVAQLERAGHDLNQAGLRLCRRVILREGRVLARAGLGAEARALVNGRSILARLGPQGQARIDDLTDWSEPA